VIFEKKFIQTPRLIDNHLIHATILYYNNSISQWQSLINFNQIKLIDRNRILINQLPVNTIPKTLLFLTTGVIIGIIISSIFWITYDRRSGSPDHKELREQGYQYISPLLECESFSQSGSIQTKTSIKTLNTLIENYQQQGYVKDVSIYYRDLNNGPWFSINDDVNYDPASLLKVPILIAYLKKAEAEPNILSKKISLNLDEGVISQKFNSAEKIIEGQEYEVEKMLEQLIVDSDNTVLETLAEFIGEDAIKSTEIKMGLIDDEQADIDFTIKVKDYSSVFRRLYNASYLNNEMSEKALKLLSKTKFDQGLKAGIPENVEVAHKFGERTFVDRSNQPLFKELHDCGIIYHQKNPYILCVMTSGEDLLKQASLIKEVSTSVYKMVDVQTFDTQ